MRKELSKLEVKPLGLLDFTPIKLSSTNTKCHSDIVAIFFNDSALHLNCRYRRVI